MRSGIMKLLVFQQNVCAALGLVWLVKIARRSYKRNG